MHKTSYYNHFIDYKDKILYFNALNQTSFAVLPQEHERLQDKWRDPIEFELAFPTVFGRFAEWGFLVDEGLNEYNVIKDRHFEEVNSAAEIHIVVNFSSEINSSGDVSVFANLFKLHLKNVIAERTTEKLILEWCTDSLTGMKNVISSINEFACHECTKLSVEFVSQIQLYVPSISNYTALDFCQKFKITALSISLSKHHDPSQNIASDVELLAKLNPSVHVVLSLYYDETQRSETIETIQGIRLQNLTLNIYGSQIMSDNTPLDKTLTPWCDMLEIRKSSYTIDMQENVYYGKYIAPDDCRIVGKLNSDGGVDTLPLARGHYYGNEWFANDKCSQCRYLPMLYALCCRSLRYYGNVEKVICPVENRTIIPESIIFNIFESKNQ